MLLQIQSKMNKAIFLIVFLLLNSSVKQPDKEALYLRFDRTSEYPLAVYLEFEGLSLSYAYYISDSTYYGFKVVDGSVMVATSDFEESHELKEPQWLIELSKNHPDSIQRYDKIFIVESKKRDSLTVFPVEFFLRSVRE